MCEGYIFRLFATKDGETIDDLIKKNMINEAVAMMEIELVALSEEISKLQENLREIKKKLGLEIEVKE